MDQLSIDYAQEALREFGVNAERIEKKSNGHTLPKLVLWADGSGHIEGGAHISFSGVDQLVKRLQKRNSKE